MPDFAIEVIKVSKEYKISHIELSGFYTLRDKIGAFFKQPLVLLKQLRTKPENFSALSDVSFTIGVGEIVAIVGGNGAGKSTLLKVLSRITPPSSGQITVVGRVTSLLEVGTGFHPELTGRENILLNGAILGKTKAETLAKFDQIVNFSGVGQFIDTPVKRYSSGMYARLAFSVAAHMDGDILLIDEVLAIGDAEFQRMCLGKMDQLVKDQSKTIIFVSHNLPAVKSLCPRSILLDKGSIIDDGPTNEVLDRYLQRQESFNLVNSQLSRSLASGLLTLDTASLVNEAGQVTNSFDCDHSIFVNFTCSTERPSTAFYGCLTIKTADGTIVWESFSHDYSANPLNHLRSGANHFSLQIPPRSLAAGHYQVYLSFSQETSHDIVDDVLVGNLELTDLSTSKGNNRNGFFSSLISWKNI